MNKRFSAKARESVLGGLVDHHITDGSNLMNALEFIEGKSGLDVRLYPVQRVIAKLIFGVPMDWEEREVPVYDMFCDELLYTFKETDYIQYVFDQGRLNIPDWRDASPDGYNEIDMIVGRRGGKSALVGAVAAYKMYRLLSLHSPQEYYGLVEGSPIDITMMAQDGEGSNRLYDQLKNYINKAPFFAPFVKTMTTEEMTFVSEADRGRRDIAPSIKAASYACLEENELIWTSEGLKSIKSVQIGDLVYDQTGHIQPIVWKKDNSSNLLAIETLSFKNDPLLLTPEHTCVYVPKEEALTHLPFLKTRNRNGRIADILDSRAKRRFGGTPYPSIMRECKAKELKEGDYFLFPQIPLDERITESLDNSSAKRTAQSRTVASLPVTPLLCRLYGLYLAEGSVPNKRDKVSWTFHIKEKETLAAFVQFTLLSEFGLPSRISTEEAANKCQVVCCSQELALGMDTWFSRGSANKTIPIIALSWNQECQRALLRGYMEGDGCRNRDIAPTVSKHLAYSLFNLAIQAGLYPSTLRRKAYMDKAGVPHKESWYLELCKLERHSRFFCPIGNTMYYWTQVSKIQQSLSEAKVVDIEVAGTHSFLTKLGATHNCTTNAVRGPSSYFLALDEFAFYRQQIGSNSDEMYEAATPATMQFKAGGVREGKRESMIFIITSPGNKIGKYYTLFRSAMEEGASSPVLAFQCSTAEMNPRSDAPFLKQQHKENPEKFKAEYGGQFLEASESYVKGSTIEECVDQDRPNKEFLTLDMVGHKYFWGLDLGMKHDATALAVCHWEGGMNELKLVYDYVDRKMVGHKEYLNFRELPLADIINWLKDVNSRLPCFKGATDQYGGSMLVQLLVANEVYGIDLVHLTGGINSQMYLTFKTLMESRQARFPNNPEFIAEVKLLEATFTNKYQVRVAAPEEKGAHDDMGDAAALAAYMAQTWALDEGRREITEIMQGVRQNLPPGEIRGNWDMNASMAFLKSYERQLQMQMNPRGAIVSPWRKR